MKSEKRIRLHRLLKTNRSLKDLISSISDGGSHSDADIQEFISVLHSNYLDISAQNTAAFVYVGGCVAHAVYSYLVQRNASNNRAMLLVKSKGNK